jgi:hypothetical protein
MTVLRTYHRPAFKASLVAGRPMPEWLRLHKRREYIVRAILSFPYWVDRAELRRVQDDCDSLTRETGIRHVIDHIVPLGHHLVCGLTVPWNLQIITYHANASKGGKFSPVECEQGTLAL